MTRATTVNIGRAILSTQYGLSEANDEAGDTPIVGMKDIQDGRVNLRPTARIHLTPKDRARYRLKKGDILLNRTNSPALVGKAAIVEEDADVVFASYLVRLKTDLNVAIPEYLNYWINSDQGQMQVQALATRAISQANLNPSTFCQHFKLPLPDRDRQRSAVRVLQVWDQGISLATALLATAEQRHTGLMQQLLTGRQRIKGFKGTWSTVRVGSFAKDVRAINIQALSLPVLSCTKYAGLVDSLRYFGKQVFSENTATYKIVRRGQFAYATNHIEEGSIGYQNLYDEALISPMYTVFEVESDVVDHRYLYMLLKTEAMRRVFEATTHSSVDRRGSLRWPEFAKLKVTLPPVPEQQRVVEVIEDAQEAVTLAEQQLQALQQQKRALLQRLLSGEPT